MNAPPEYLLEQPFDQVPCFNDGKVGSSRPARSSNISASRANALLPRDPQGRYRAIQWTYAALNSVEPAILNFSAHRPFLCRRGMGEAAPAGCRGIRTLKLKRVSDWLGDKDWLEGDASPSATC